MKENECHPPHKKMKNIDHSSTRFKLKTHTRDAFSDSLSFGPNLRQPTNHSRSSKRSRKNGNAANSSSLRDREKKRSGVALGKGDLSSDSLGLRAERSGKERRVQWVRSHIRVRIISKTLEGGRFYMKKGEVVDVVEPYLCDIIMDEGKQLVQRVDQDHLETALPRKGGPVLVLYGEHKGAYGNLVERDLNREAGVVLDADTYELLRVDLEQIAEYVGDPSHIGYQSSW